MSTAATQIRGEGQKNKLHFISSNGFRIKCFHFPLLFSNALLLWFIQMDCLLLIYSQTWLWTCTIVVQTFSPSVFVNYMEIKQI